MQLMLPFGVRLYTDIKKTDSDPAHGDRQRKINCSLENAV